MLFFSPNQTFRIVKIKEKASKLYAAFADDFKPVKHIEEGQIGVISGLKQSATGDILLCGNHLNDNIRGEVDNEDPQEISLNLPAVHIPDPVLYATIEPASMSHQKKLELALTNLAREDPSLRVTFGGSGDKLEGGKRVESQCRG